MAKHLGYYFFGARGNKLVAAIIVCAGAGFLLLGFDQGVLSGVITNPDFLSAMKHPTSGVIGTIVAIYDVGAFLGAMCCSVFGEKLGRKGSTYAGLTIMLIGAAIQTSSYSVAQMIVGRICTGLGMGTLAATLPMWAAEMVKPAHRGKLLSSLGSSIGFGILFSYWLEYGLSFVDGPVSWRFPVSFQMIIASVSLVLLPFLPESPRWLIAHDRLDEAVAVLAAVEAKDATEQHPNVVARRDDIILALELEHAQGPVKWRELFQNNETKNRRRVILAIGINLFQQMSGVNALVYYIPFLLETTMGLPRSTSLWVSGLNGVTFFLASLYPVFFLDRWGRKKPFIIASASCCINMMMVAILLSLNKQSTNYAAIVFFFTYIAVYGIAFMGTPFMYTPELLPLRLRAKGSAVATSFSWLSTFVVVEITPPGVTNLGWRFYIIWAVLAATFVPLIYIFYPETARKSLEEIDEIFMDKEGIFQARNKIGRASKNDLESLEKSDDASVPKVATDKDSSEHLETVGPTGHGN